MSCVIYLDYNGVEFGFCEAFLGAAGEGFS